VNLPSKKKGFFQPGNNLSVGNKGRQAPSLVTQELVSQLNEIDKNTGKEKKHAIVANLIKLAMGYTWKKKIKLSDGTDSVEEVVVQPDIVAIKEVFDRAEGKAKHQLVTGQDGGAVQFEDVASAREKLGKLLELKVVPQEEKKIE
jgi:hypothetical protein